MFLVYGNATDLEAAQAALDEASKTIKGITGLEVDDITAKVDPDSRMISQ